MKQQIRITSFNYHQQHILKTAANLFNVTPNKQASDTLQ